MNLIVNPSDQAGGGGGVLVVSLPWADVLAAYLDAATDSPETRRSYSRHIREGMTALEVRTLGDLSGVDLTRYRAAVLASPVAPASQAQALAAMRSFLKWAGTMGAHGLSGDVIRVALKGRSATVQTYYTTLTEPEVAAILDVADTTRDSALLSVLLGAGVRVAEAVGLDPSDLREDHEGGAALTVRQGKGRKDRTIPIQPGVARLLRRYLAETGRTIHTPGPLFRAHDRGATKLPRGRLTTRAVAQLVTRTAKRANIDAKRISPHALRHTFAMRSLRHNGDVLALSKLLGHASVTTTQRYTDHLDNSELRAAIPHLPGQAA